MGYPFKKAVFRSAECYLLQSSEVEYPLGYPFKKAVFRRKKSIPRITLGYPWPCGEAVLLGGFLFGLAVFFSLWNLEAPAS